MKKIFTRKKILVLIVTIIISGSSLLFFSFSNDDFKLVKSLEIYYSLFRELNLFYVDETNPEKLVQSSIDGMLKSLDPYTTFIPESDRENFNFMTTGQYGGIGALIRRKGEYSIIAEPYEGFPAAKAGLRAGDTILFIDGESMKNNDISYISDRLKGKPNTEVKVTVKRLGMPEEIETILNREKIKIPNVPYYGLLNENIGYIRLSNFTTGAASEVKEALESLKKKHNISAVVLDLRANPGGLLIEAVDIANLFVRKDQEIVSTKGRVKQWDYVYKTRYNPVDTVIPVAILVNRISASASEIVAGSLQDLDRAVIIGQRTYGKGLVQTTRDLNYNTKLKVTTAKYYIPSGRCIQALDYSNRNDDGSVGTIPDSLISEYKTKNGRSVFDGGGIMPDFKTMPEDYSQVALALFSQSMIFDYATHFVSKHETIPSVSEFEISDNVFEDFRQYIANKDFYYETRSEESFKKLVEIAKREKYYNIAKKEFDDLEEKLAHDNNKDLINFKPEIVQLLKEEICNRYYLQKGRVQASIENDPEINKSVEILSNPGLYVSTLLGKQKHIQAHNAKNN